MMSFRKILSVIATSALLFNSIAPYSLAMAQTVEPSPTPTDSATPVDTSTPTATPTDSTGSTTLTTSSLTASPTAQPTDQPTATPTDLASPQSSTEAGTPTPTDQPVVTQAPESNPTTTAPPSDTNNATPSVTTDKADYHPGETATVTGSFFNALENLFVKIFGGSTGDGTYTESTSNVTTDASGNFSLAYTLDNIFRPLYTAHVFDAASTQPIASTTFTDTTDKVDICHATGSNSNPYTDANADKTADAGGHDGHNGPIWFPGILVTWGGYNSTFQL